MFLLVLIPVHDFLVLNDLSFNPSKLSPLLSAIMLSHIIFPAQSKAHKKMHSSQRANISSTERSHFYFVECNCGINDTEIQMHKNFRLLCIKQSTVLAVFLTTRSANFTLLCIQTNQLIWMQTNFVSMRTLIIILVILDDPWTNGGPAVTTIHLDTDPSIWKRVTDADSISELSILLLRKLTRNWFYRYCSIMEQRYYIFWLLLLIYFAINVTY